MQYRCILLTGILCCLLSTVIGSYDGGYVPTHDHDDYYEPSYPAPPIVHPQHHGHGHSSTAGSYYHYHVPLVGQQQHYQPSYHHQDHSHYLWPLLLLLALPLLFLPLLPLLLLPIGISLLALLAPGAMMMMMMMMMMGGEMMMRRDTVSGRAFNEMRNFGEVLLFDMTSLMSKYARSFDLDQCPQHIACEMGAIIFPENNSTDASTAKAFSSFIMEQYLPKGKVRTTVKKYEKAFWTGSSSINSCKAFTCQPAFKVYTNFQEKQTFSTSGNSTKINEQQKDSSKKWTAQKHVNYVYAHSNGNDDPKNHKNNISPIEEVKLGTTDSSAKLKMKRSHYPHPHRYGSQGKVNVDEKSPSYLNINQPKKTYFSNMFGTPTIKS